MEQTNQPAKQRNFTPGLVILSLAVLAGCVILAHSFATHFYSSSGGDMNFPDRVYIQESDYLEEFQAVQYVGLISTYYDDNGVWHTLIRNGELDGTFVTFFQPAPEDYPEKGGYEVRVFSKAKLDAWMNARFGELTTAAVPE